jgi:hypothetical protein
LAGQHWGARRNPFYSNIWAVCGKFAGTLRNSSVGSVAAAASPKKKLPSSPTFPRVQGLESAPPITTKLGNRIDTFGDGAGLIQRRRLRPRAVQVLSDSRMPNTENGSRRRSGPQLERCLTKETGMLRRVVGAFVVLGICVGISLADEIQAVIFKVDGNKVTFKKAVKKGEPLGEEMTLPVADNVKVVKGKFNKDKTFEKTADIEEGLKDKMFTDIDSEKGRRAMLVTDDDGKKITEIRIFEKKKKKDQ